MNTQAIERLYQVVGQSLREARLRAGMSQQLVSARLGMTRASVANLEAGRQHMPLHRLYAYAATVGLPINELFPDLEGLAPGAEEPAFELVLGRRLPSHQARFVRSVLAADAAARGG